MSGNANYFSGFELSGESIKLTKFRLLDDFKISISGFIDTLKVSKIAFCKSDTENFKQETFFAKQYEAHNALADVRALQ